MTSPRKKKVVSELLYKWARGVFLFYTTLFHMFKIHWLFQNSNVPLQVLLIVWVIDSCAFYHLESTKIKLKNMFCICLVFPWKLIQAITAIMLLIYAVHCGGHPVQKIKQKKGKKRNEQKNCLWLAFCSIAHHLPAAPNEETPQQTKIWWNMFST